MRDNEVDNVAAYPPDATHQCFEYCDRREWVTHLQLYFDKHVASYRLVTSESASPWQTKLMDQPSMWCHLMSDNLLLMELPSSRACPCK